MASLTIRIDAAPAGEIVAELNELHARLGWDRIPEHLRGRVARLLATQGLVRLEPVDRGVIVAEPSAELLSIVATLRALAV